MSLKPFGYTREYLQDNPECRWSVFGERVSIAISKSRKGIGCALLLGATLSTEAAHSQETEGINTTHESGYAGTMDDITEAWILSTLIKASAAGFDMDDFKYEMTTNPSIREDIHVLSDPEVLYTTKAISRDFLNETGYTLDMLDIIAVAKVVQSKISMASDPLLFEDELTHFLTHYPHHESIFGGIFGKHLLGRGI